jgi:hypothetical protein
VDVRVEEERVGSLPLERAEEEVAGANVRQRARYDRADHKV